MSAELDLASFQNIALLKGLLRPLAFTDRSVTAMIKSKRTA